MSDMFLLRTAAWMSFAACLDAPVCDAFPYSKAQAREFIRDYCNRCPVLEQCAAWAVLHKVTAGVWGGVLVAKDCGEAA